MNVAIICPYDLGMPGGVQDQAERLVGWLESAGHDATLIGPGTSGPEGSVLLGSTMVIPANKSAVPVAIDPRVARKVKEAVAEADVVHIHEPLMPVVSLAATRIKEKPTVGTFHADASGATRAGLRLGKPLVRLVASRLDVITAVSPVAESTVDWLPDIRIIPNGVDLSDYSAAAKTDGSVLFLGRDDPRKGLDVILEAWPQVLARHPTAHLNVVGAERPDIIDGVEFLGRVSGEEKYRILSESSVYVAPNLGGESFGIVVAEGMASGCAVVASALPAFARVLGDAGRMVAPGDAEGLGEAVGDLLNDTAMRTELAEAALKRVERFDGSKVAAAYIDAYEDAIIRHGA
ncbi:MAG: glycosyltransferase family 4 protein [Acidimicrobiia bacterium]